MKRSKQEILTKELNKLYLELSSPSSDIGDWKIAKCSEYKLLGLEIPYDLDELHSKRQAIRDRINEINEELSKLNEENEGADL